MKRSVWLIGEKDTECTGHGQYEEFTRLRKSPGYFETWAEAHNWIRQQKYNEKLCVVEVPPV